MFQITSYWIPTIHQVLGDDHSKPVILVGNKCDATDGTSTMDQILPIMNQFNEIETCVEVKKEIFFVIQYDIFLKFKIYTFFSAQQNL